MIVTQVDTSRQIIITDVYGSEWNFVHAVVRVTTQLATLYDSSITDLSSTFTLSTDGLYYLVSFKLPLTKGITETGYYITTGKIYKWVGNVITEVNVIDLLNLSNEEYDFGLDKTYEFIMHKYSILKNISVINKTLAKITDTCLTNKPLEQMKDTLTMGVFVVNKLFEDEQWHNSNMMIEKLSICGGSFNINSQISYNCNG